MRQNNVFIGSKETGYTTLLHMLYHGYILHEIKHTNCLNNKDTHMEVLGKSNKLIKILNNKHKYHIAALAITKTNGNLINSNDKYSSKLDKL